jgi:hypothetical protein
MSGTEFDWSFWVFITFREFVLSATKMMTSLWRVDSLIMQSFMPKLQTEFVHDCIILMINLNSTNFINVSTVTSESLCRNSELQNSVLGLWIFYLLVCFLILIFSFLLLSLGCLVVLPADHSGRAVLDMNCLRPLKHWGRGFESHSRHECLCAFILCLCYSVFT